MLQTIIFWCLGPIAANSFAVMVTAVTAFLAIADATSSVSGLSPFATSLIAIVKYALFTALSFFASLLPWVQYAVEFLYLPLGEVVIYVGGNSFDLAVIFMCFVILSSVAYAVSPLLIALLRAVYNLTTFLLNLPKTIFFGVYAVNAVYPLKNEVGRGSDLGKVWIQTAGAIPVHPEGINAGAQTLTTPAEMPKCVFQVFTKIGDDVILVGHGACVNNILYTDNHVVEGCEKVYIGRNVGKGPIKAVEVSVRPSDILARNYDLAILHRKGVAAMLGIRSAEFGFCSQGPVSVFSFDTEKAMYTMQCVVPEAPIKEWPYHLFTATNTRPGDSGMPVMQNKKVVAFHNGDGAKDYSGRNVAIIPVLQILPLIEKRVNRSTPALQVVQTAETSVYDSSVDDRAEYIMDHKEVKAQVSAMKSLGLHEGLDGRETDYDLLQARYAELKGSRNWADMDEADDYIERLRRAGRVVVETNRVADLKVSAPAPVAPKVTGASGATQSPTPKDTLSECDALRSRIASLEFQLSRCVSSMERMEAQLRTNESLSKQSNVRIQASSSPSASSTAPLAAAQSSGTDSSTTSGEQGKPASRSSKRRARRASVKSGEQAESSKDSVKASGSNSVKA